MYWALDLPSGPFRTTTYSPELFVEQPLDESAHIAIGYRHDSNGRAVGDSIDVNRIYLRAVKRFDLGNGWHAEVAPQGWIYFGPRGLATDLEDYWGYTSLTASIAKDDGLKVAATVRGSFETGRAGTELFVSYPLSRFKGGFGVYLFGQAFHGYGEALSDYNLSDTHARIGIALTR
jgi:outer membrane phospholipase A